MSTLRLPPPSLSAPGPHDQPGGLDLAALARGVLQRLHVVALVAVLGAVAGYAATRVLPPRYTSAAALLIDPRRPGTFGAETEFANLYIDSNKIGNVTSILESSMLLSKVVASERLADIPYFGDMRPSRLEMLVGRLPFVELRPPLPDTPELREQRAVARLASALTVSRVAFTYVIRIEVALPDPILAQSLAGAVARAYLNDQRDTKLEAIRRDSQWLNERITALRDKLQQSEAAVDAIRARYNLTETDRGPDSTTGRQLITSLNAELARAQQDTAARKAKLDQALQVQARGGNLESVPEVARSLDNLRRQQVEMERRVAQLSARYAPNHPELARAQEERRSIDRQIAEEVARAVAGLRAEYDTARNYQAGIEQQLGRATAAEGGAISREGELQLREAQRLVQANRALYESLLARQRDVEQQETRQDSEARLISLPGMPSAPSFPKRSVFIAMGGVAGVGLGAGIAVLLGFLQSGFGSVPEIERRLGLPVLATLPRLGARETAIGRKRVRIPEFAAARPLSRFAESVRALRVALVAAADGRTPRVVCVTSAVPGEGKSTLAAALAVSSATAGLRTVLLDADLHRRSLSRQFGLQGQPGLVDVVRGDLEPAAALVSYRDLPLGLLGVGAASDVVPDLVSSGRFSGLLSDLSRQHDVVIVDAPPVLAVSDARVLAGLADSTVMVVEWRATGKPAVAQALKILRFAQARLAGIVLNKVDAGGMREYQHGSRYYRQYERAADRYFLN